MIAVLFSLAAIAGTAIVYWVLMSNFLYYSGTYIHGKIYFLFLSYNVQLLSALLGKTFKPSFHIVLSVVSVERKKFIGPYKCSIQKKRQIQLFVRDRMNSICPMNFFLTTDTTDTTDTTIWKLGLKTRLLGQIEFILSRTSCICRFCCIEHL